MANLASSLIIISKQGETTTTNLSSGLNSPYSVFMSLNGDIYVDNGLTNGRVDKFLFNTTTSVPAMTVSAACFDLFIDLNGYLYCSLKTLHQVVRVLLSSGSTTPTIVAGTGVFGNTPTTLNSQQGIYVDSNSNLYVADCLNNRIQQFASGQTSGVTVNTGSIILNNPTDIAFDKDGYLYIVDSGNHRIIGSDSTGFQCIFACSGFLGVTATALSSPQSLSFDSYGNIYVADRDNNRIQKFAPPSSTCT